jgi:hypothetical protein
MLPVATPRIDEMADGATSASRGVAILRSLPVLTTTAHAIDVLAWRLAVPLHDPRSTVDRGVIPDRPVAAPRIALRQRILSP